MSRLKCSAGRLGAALTPSVIWAAYASPSRILSGSYFYTSLFFLHWKDEGPGLWSLGQSWVPASREQAPLGDSAILRSPGRVPAMNEKRKC